MNESGIGHFPPATADFLPQYKAIGQSLKKRFFRKPNVAEAIAQYENLAQELQREDQKSFAAVCFLEAAKAQDSLNHHVPQANSLVRAGKLFLGAWESEKHFVDVYAAQISLRDKDCEDRGASTHLFGNLELGIQTLNQAAKSFNSQGYKGLAMLLNLQLGDILYRDGSFGEALNYYKRALISAKLHFSFPDQLTVTRSVVSAKIKLMEFESALKTVSDVLIGIKNYEASAESPSTSTHPVALPLMVASIRQKFEITKVLLVLILGGTSTDVFEFIWPKSQLPSGSEGHEGEGAGGVESEDIHTSGSASGGGGTSGGGVESGVNVKVNGGTRRKEDDHSKKGLQITYLLKSLVIAIQEGSSQDLRQVHNQLIPDMEEPHHDLMRFLIKLQS